MTGQDFRALRERLGLSPTELAEKMGYTRGRIHQLEAKSAIPRHVEKHVRLIQKARK